MWEQFWIQNLHYVLEVFVAFLMITAGWIYFDGWLIERRAKTFFRSIGFFILMLWGLFGAIPEGSYLLSSVWGDRIPFTAISMIAGFFGFGMVFVSLLMDPIPVKPGDKPPLSFLFGRWLSPSSFAILSLPSFDFSSFNLPSLRLPSFNLPFFHLPSFDFPSFNLPSLHLPSFNFPAFNFPSFDYIIAGIRGSFSFLRSLFVPFLGMLGILFFDPTPWLFLFAFLTALLLWLHYTKGIQSEWRFFAIGYFFLAGGLGVAMVASFFAESTNVLIAHLVAPYQTLWIIEHLLKLIGAVCLGAWAWGFIRFRVFPQIFSSFVAISFILFVATALFYTGFLLSRAQEQATHDLKANIKTFDFALRKVKESAILAARITAVNPNIREAIKRNNREALHTNLNTLMFENETDFMLALNTGGQVLARAEDKERFGDSLANDPVVWRALDGKASVTASVEEGIAIPQMSIKAASPVIDTTETGEAEIIGAVITGYRLDLAFVDGVKKITDLEITIFANDTSAATTFTSPETNLPLLGIKETNQTILNTVLKKGDIYTGTALVLNNPFLTDYVPLREIEETPVGMLFTGRSQASLLALTGETMRRTFTLSILFMIFSLFPLWWLARFIAHNQQI